MSKTKFDKVPPHVEEKMRQIEDAIEPLPTTEQLSALKPLPKELVSGDTTAHLAFTVRIEKDLKERLSFLVLLLKRSGDKNISVASTVEKILRDNVNSQLKELGYNIDGDNIQTN